MAKHRLLGTRQMSSAFMAYAAAGLLLLLVAILQIDTPQAVATQRARAPINQEVRFVANKVSGNLIQTSRSRSHDHEASGPGLSITKKPVQSIETKAPAITKVSPISGPSTGGTAVTITGSNFASNARVEFGSTASTKVSFVSSNEIKATSPSEAPGTIDVRVIVRKQKSPVVAKDKFTFKPPVCTDSWTGAANSSWSTAGNWNKQKVPGAKDVACILTGKPGLPVQLASSIDVATVTNEGGLQISGSLSVKAGNSTSSGPLTFDDGGTFSGPGTVTVTGTFTALGGTTIVTGGQLVNQGTGTIDSSGQLSVASGATVTNAGTLTMDEGSDIDGYGCGSAGVFDNTGTLDVAPGSSQTAYIGEEECGLTVNNSATIDLQSGTLENEDSDGFTFNLDTGSSITGTGTFEDVGDLVANAAVSLPTLAMSSGSISGSGNVTVTGTLTISYATFSGPGTVTVTGTFTALGGTTILTGGQLVNQGKGTLDSSDGLYLANGATFTNSGTLTMDQNSNIDGYGCGTGGVFNNTGTLDVAPGSSQTAYIGEEECGLTVNDSAAIDLQSGALENEDSDGFTFGLDTGSSITGTGTFEDEGDLVANAAVSISTLNMSGGTLELAPQVDIDVTSFSGTSGTVQLDAGSATQFGQIVVTTSVNPTDLSLDLNPTFSPTCGESVTGLQASSVSGPFEFADGPAPFGGTWAVFSTSTSAGATVECFP